MSTENLKVVITGDASGLDKTSAQAKVALDKVSASAAAWDKRARELNQQINYTSRAYSDMGTSAASAATKIAATSREVQITSEAMKGMNKTSSSATNSLFALSGIIQDAPYGFRAIGNNITFFTQQMAYSAKEAGGFGAAIKAIGGAMLGPAGIIFAISAGVSLLTTFFGASGQSAKQVDELANKVKDLRDGLKDLTDVQGDTLQSTAKQRAQLNLLYAAATDVTRSQQERIKAAKDLQDLFPKRLKSISQLKIISGEAAAAFNSLSENILKVGQAQAIVSQVVDNFKSIGKATGDIDKMRVHQHELYLEWVKQRDALKSLEEGGATIIPVSMVRGVKSAKKALDDYTKKMIDTGSVIQDAITNNKKLEDSFNAIDFKGKGGAGGGSGTGLTGIAKVMADLAADFRTADSLAKILGLSVEQVGSLKMKDLSDAMMALAKISTPEAIAKAKELGAQYDALASKSFLPVLSGGRAGVNAPSPLAGGVQVPTTAQGKLPAWLDQGTEQIANMNKAGRELQSTFEGIFSSLANGANPFQALLQAVEQLIIKLAAAAAAAAVLDIITGGGASGFGAIFGKLSGLTGALPHFAQGGFIPSPQLAVVGDAPGGEWVLNQKQISAILNGSGGGRNIHVTGTLIGEGSQLKAVIDTTGRKQGRRG